MRFKLGYNLEINGELIRLAYFCSTNADNALQKLESFRLQGLQFKSLDDLNKWLAINAVDECGKFIWH